MYADILVTILNLAIILILIIHSHEEKFTTERLKITQALKLALINENKFEHSIKLINLLMNRPVISRKLLSMEN